MTNGDSIRDSASYGVPDFERFIRQFEQAWFRGERPILEHYLHQTAGAKILLLVELVHAELEFRLRQGEPTKVEQYLERFPELAVNPETVWQLAKTELRVRQLLGNPPTAAEIRERFPGSATKLVELLHSTDGAVVTSRPQDRRWSSPPQSMVRYLQCPHCGHTVKPESEVVEIELYCPFCEASFGVVSDDTVSHVPASTRVGHFELLERVGMGSFGTVWKARDTKLDRTVAVKIPRPDRISRESLEKFLREARSAAQLRHSNIVSVHEVGREDDKLFIVSEYIQGASLADWMVMYRLTIRQAVELCRKVATALHAAHSAGIIHRDLKPSNILIDEDGEPHLTDFGLAKREVGEVTMTLDGQILGTPAYMSPEQARGEAHRADRRTDIYSLGVVLFEMLTGERPFRGNMRMLLYQVLHDEPRALRRLNDQISLDLETICLKTLEKDPAQRYSTAAALADDLTRILEGRPISARPITRTVRSWRWCRRNPALAGLITSVAFLVLLVTAITSVAAWQLQQALVEKSYSEQQARSREADALIGEAHGIRLSGLPGQRFVALQALEQAMGIVRELSLPLERREKIRNETAAALALADIHVTHSWPGFPAGTWSVVPSRDFHLYAHATEEGEIGIYRLQSHQLVARLPIQHKRVRLAFGPRRWLAVRGETSRSFELWNVADQNPLRQLVLTGVQSWDFASDGTRLLVQFDDGRIALYECSSARELHSIHSSIVGKRSEVLLNSNPEFPYVVIHSYDHYVFEIRDLRDGKKIAEIDPPWRTGHGVGAWHPTGLYFVMPDGNGGSAAVYALDPSNKAQVRESRVLEPVQTNGGLALTFNPQGDRVAGRDWSGAIFLWDWDTGRVLFQSTATESSAREQLVWDDSGRYLGLCRLGDRGDQVGVLSVADGREYRVIQAQVDIFWPNTPQPNIQYDIHPQGRLLAMGASQAAMTLIDLVAGEVLQRVPIPKGVMHVHFGDQGDMFTHGGSGTWRWPYLPQDSTSQVMAYGAPIPLDFPRGPGMSPLSISGSGDVVFVAAYGGYNETPFAGGWLLAPHQPKSVNVVPGDSVGTPCVSRDGKYVAFFVRSPSAPQSKVQVLEVNTRQIVHEMIATSIKHYAMFSADGEFLVTDVAGGQLLRVGTWQVVRRLGGGELCDVSADSTTAVYEMPDHSFRLVDLHSGHDLIRLDDPSPRARRPRFLPNGSGLVVSTPQGFTIWHLSRMREILRKKSLDWDATNDVSVPESSTVSSGQESLTVKLLELPP